MIYNLDTLREDLILDIGNQGENNARVIQFDIAAWQAKWPGGSITAAYKRPDETAWHPVAPSNITTVGSTVSWTVVLAQTEHGGYGFVVITYSQGGVVRKSPRIITVVRAGAEPAGPAPDTVADWIAEANTALNAIKTLEFAINEDGELLAGETVLGRVSDNPRGNYNPDADPLYSKRDIVFDNGGSFRYINDTPSNEPTSSTSHWQQVASVGGQDILNAVTAEKNAAIAAKVLAEGYAAQLASGTASPAGTYANLAALNSGTPTAPNTAKIYITLDDGNWCYWDGTAWVAGGVYQAASVAAQLADNAAQVYAVNAKQGDIIRSMSEWGARHNLRGRFEKYVFADTDLNGYPIFVLTDGYNYITNFDVSAFRHTGGTTYYASPTGLSPNDGLSESTPYETVSRAYSHAVDGDTIIVMDGMYTREQWLNVASVKVEKSINIIAQNPGKVIVKLGSDHVYTINETYSNVYQTARTNVAKVIQMFCDDTIELTNVASVALCAATEGSWHNDGTNTYVHLYDNLVPTNSNTILLLRTGYALIHTLCSSQNVHLYLEGITFIGGHPSSVLFSNSASYKDPKLYTKNCKFKHAYDEYNANDAISILGATAYFQNCEASFSNKDGFNYHAANGKVCSMIEVNCIGRNNGFGSPNNNNNGSTLHDGSKGIRLSGTYYGNKGANVADAMAGTVSANLGCVAFDSTAGTNDVYDGDFVAQQSGATMYLENCKAFGSKYGAYAVPGSTMHVRNCDLEVAGGGTIVQS